MTHPEFQPFLCTALDAFIDRYNEEHFADPKHLTLTQKQFEVLKEELTSMLPPMLSCISDGTAVLPMYRCIPIKVIP